MGMEHGDEADEDADGPPQQAGGAELELHIFLAIDGGENSALSSDPWGLS